LRMFHRSGAATAAATAKVAAATANNTQEYLENARAYRAYSLTSISSCLYIIPLVYRKLSVSRTGNDGWEVSRDVGKRRRQTRPAVALSLRVPRDLKYIYIHRQNRSTQPLSGPPSPLRLPPPSSRPSPSHFGPLRHAHWGGGWGVGGG
jgi:hypothetical protein